MNKSLLHCVESLPVWLHQGTYEFAWMKSRCSWARRRAAYLSPMAWNEGQPTWPWETETQEPKAIRLPPRPRSRSRPRPRSREGTWLAAHALLLAARARSSALWARVSGELSLLLVLEPPDRNRASVMRLLFLSWGLGNLPIQLFLSFPGWKMEPKASASISSEMITRIHTHTQNKKSLDRKVRKGGGDGQEGKGVVTLPQLLLSPSKGALCFYPSTHLPEPLGLIMFCFCFCFLVEGKEEKIIQREKRRTKDNQKRIWTLLYVETCVPWKPFPPVSWHSTIWCVDGAQRTDILYDSKRQNWESGRGKERLEEKYKEGLSMPVVQREVQSTESPKLKLKWNLSRMCFGKLLVGMRH